MESLIPSEIDRLVYGHLLEEAGCSSLAQKYLEISPHLRECFELTKRGRKFATTLHNGLCLSEVLDEHTDVYAFVREKSIQLGVNVPRSAVGIVDKLNLIWNALASQKLQPPSRYALEPAVESPEHIHPTTLTPPPITTFTAPPTTTFTPTPTTTFTAPPTTTFTAPPTTTFTPTPTTTFTAPPTTTFTAPPTTTFTPPPTRLTLPVAQRQVKSSTETLKTSMVISDVASVTKTCNVASVSKSSSIAVVEPKVVDLGTPTRSDNLKATSLNAVTAHNAELVESTNSFSSKNITAVQAATYAQPCGSSSELPPRDNKRKRKCYPSDIKKRDIRLPNSPSFVDVSPTKYILPDCSTFSEEPDSATCLPVAEIVCKTEPDSEPDETTAPDSTIEMIERDIKIEPEEIVIKPDMDSLLDSQSHMDTSNTVTPPSREFKSINSMPQRNWTATTSNLGYDRIVANDIDPLSMDSGDEMLQAIIDRDVALLNKHSAPGPNVNNPSIVSMSCRVVPQRFNQSTITVLQPAQLPYAQNVSVGQPNVPTSSFTQPSLCFLPMEKKMDTPGVSILYLNHLGELSNTPPVPQLTHNTIALISKPTYSIPLPQSVPKPILPRPPDPLSQTPTKAVVTHRATPTVFQVKRKYRKKRGRPRKDMPLRRRGRPRKVQESPPCPVITLDSSEPDEIQMSSTRTKNVAKDFKSKR